ncbi:hypothetical protein V3C99_011933 [Haemonchus contortus]|uniref:Uncharacterized protein n=1 Tax=Haemonchus contortus TaxID=6289 RepID=A0A7I5E7M1_HAECO
MALASHSSLSSIRSSASCKERTQSSTSQSVHTSSMD